MEGRAYKMAGRINSNKEAQFASRLLGINQQEQNKSLAKIASGLRINRSSDDAAGLAISERLRALSQGFEQSQNNLQDAASALQVAEGGLTNVSDSLQRIRELTIQSANDTLTDEDRSLIQEEVDQLVAEIDRQTQATQFNGRPLLTGDFDEASGGFKVQVGPNEGDTLQVNIDGTSTANLGIATVDVSTRDAASNALSSIDSAINGVSSLRANIGANANRISNASDFVGVARENTLSALSTIRDTNFADEASNLALGQIRNQSNLSALAQANLNPRSVLQLLGQ